MGTDHSVHYSTGKSDYVTPDYIFNPLEDEFSHFDIDVCATNESTKCEYYFDKEVDGLSVSWYEYGDCMWMNPPYGKEIAAWVQKAWDESFDGVTTVCLLPARTDTKWFSIFYEHANYRMRGPNDEIRFLKGRIKFEGAEYCAPFPSMIVVLKDK